MFLNGIIVISWGGRGDNIALHNLIIIKLAQYTESAVAKLFYKVQCMPVTDIKHFLGEGL